MIAGVLRKLTLVGHHIRLVFAVRKGDEVADKNKVNNKFRSCCGPKVIERHRRRPLTNLTMVRSSPWPLRRAIHTTTNELRLSDKCALVIPPTRRWDNTTVDRLPCTRCWRVLTFSGNLLIATVQGHTQLIPDFFLPDRIYFLRPIFSGGISEDFFRLFVSFVSCHGPGTHVCGSCQAQDALMILVGPDQPASFSCF